MNLNNNNESTVTTTDQEGLAMNREMPAMRIPVRHRTDQMPLMLNHGPDDVRINGEWCKRDRSTIPAMIEMRNRHALMSYRESFDVPTLPPMVNGPMMSALLATYDDRHRTHTVGAWPTMETVESLPIPAAPVPPMRIRSEMQRDVRKPWTMPLYGLSSVLPEGTVTIGNPFADWTDKDRDDNRSPGRKGESLSWCRKCGMVADDGRIPTRNERKRFEACAHTMTTVQHDEPGAPVGTTVYVHPSIPCELSADAWPKEWIRNEDGDWTHTVANDHGSFVRRLKVPTDKAHSSNPTGQSPDMSATSAARSLIGTGRWSVRTGEAKRFGTPNRGRIVKSLASDFSEYGTFVVGSDGETLLTGRLSGIVRIGTLTKTGKVAKKRNRRSASAIRSATIGQEMPKDSKPKASAKVTMTKKEAKRILDDMVAEAADMHTRRMDHGLESGMVVKVKDGLIG